MDNVDLKIYNQLLESYREYNEYLTLLKSIEIMSDNKLFSHYLKKKKKIESVALLFKNYESIDNDIKINNEIFELEQDDEIKLKIAAENQKLKEEQKKIFDAMKIEYLKIEQIKQTVQVEITAKSDGLDFIQRLVDMIHKIFEGVDVFVELGKTTIIKLTANLAYEKLKFLSGLVKQVKQGVEQLFVIVVLNIQKEEIVINESDIDIQISKSSGAGGQHINKTESAVKLTHIPTGITAECQDERSQIKNKARALEHLKLKIMQKYEENTQKNIKNQRANQKNAIFSSTPTVVFDFDQNKVHDNRTSKDYDLKNILNGETILIESDLRI